MDLGLRDMGFGIVFFGFGFLILDVRLGIIRD